MFDPALPQEGTPLDAAQMRSQLNGLKAIIDAILTLTAAQVDAVNTVEPSSPANASVSVTGNTLHFTFDIPRGNDGIQGTPGSDGSPGPEGAQGPPFANALIEAVNTLEPGEPATVSVSFDGTNVLFTFGIPRGNDGVNGTDGQPGEVSQTDLNNAQLDTLSQTSNNSNSVSTLDTSFADPDSEELRNKINELINALRR